MQRFLYSVVAIFFVACQPSSHISVNREVNRLTRMLQRLNDGRYATQSHRLADDIIRYARFLESDFKRDTSPIVHNFLVNIGIKQKGLCYHFSDALYLHLYEHYSHFRFHLVGTHIGSYFKEHNALLITGEDNNLSNGVIIDAWREKGRVVFVPVTKDRYVWHHRKARGCD